MAINGKRGGLPKKKPSCADQEAIPSIRPLSLRLPVPLRKAAERYADDTGLSLNGLLCVALTDYLASRGHRIRS